MLLKQSAVLFTICQSKKYWYSLSEQKKYCLQINEYWINKNACLNTVLQANLAENYEKQKYSFLFWKMPLKKTTEYFLKFLFFYLKVQSFRLAMENNFIQMFATASHAVPYTIGAIFKHIIDCVQLQCSFNGFTNIVL